MSLIGALGAAESAISIHAYVISNDTSDENMVTAWSCSFSRLGYRNRSRGWRGFQTVSTQSSSGGSPEIVAVLPDDFWRRVQNRSSGYRCMSGM